MSYTLWLGIASDLRDCTMKDIKGFEGKYGIDKKGNVYSHSRFGARSGRLLNPSTTSFGYKQVVLYKDNKRHVRSVHRLVAEAYISNPQDKEQVNHIDGDKGNNILSNLEWCTRSENQLHAIHKLKVKVQRKISIDDASEIIEAYATGLFKRREIAKYFGVCKSTINNVLNNNLKYTNVN